MGFVYLALLHCFNFDEVMLAPALPTWSAQNRPLQPALQHPSSLQSLPALLIFPVLCLSHQPTRCQQTHGTQQDIPNTSACFQRLWENTSVLTSKLMKINTSLPPPPSPPPNNAPWFLVFLGPPDSDTDSVSPLIFHSHLSTGVTSGSLR